MIAVAGTLFMFHFLSERSVAEIRRFRILFGAFDRKPKTMFFTTSEWYLLRSRVTRVELKYSMP